MTLQEQATEYLGTVIQGFVPGGFDIACEDSDVGLAFSVVPKFPEGYKAILGYKGRNCALLRHLMYLWKDKNAPHLSVHVFVPNPNYIEKQTI